MNSIKNETISYQIFVKKNSRKQKAVLLSRIENLKKTLPAGSEPILELESALNKQVDLELRAEIENMSNFEYLNDEKITLKSVNVLLELNAVTAQYRLARK